MSITHEEARRLIQFRADDALKALEKNILEAHLTTCQECQHYAAVIRDLETTLQPLMQRKWNQHPLPHSTAKVVSSKSSGFIQNIFFATRIAAVGVICIAFLFNIWQFTQTGLQRTNPPSADIPLIPTPSVQSTTTNVIHQKCEPILYEVRNDDTLESIANQFSISAIEIMEANQLRTGTLIPSMKISIPACTPTPSGKSNTATTTFTPVLGPTTLTPANSPTQ
jgi:LysM repeat protein